jgi:hypothetical protein
MTKSWRQTLGDDLLGDSRRVSPVVDPLTPNCRIPGAIGLIVTSHASESFRHDSGNGVFVPLSNY